MAISKIIGSGLGTLSALTVDDITINGSTISDGGDLTVDVGGSITLDADDGNVKFKDASVTFGQMQNGTGSQFIMQGLVSNQDMIFKVNDGGSAVNALVFDASDAGAAAFNDKVTIGDGKLVLNSTAVTSTAAELNILDGVTSTAAELNILDGVTSTAAELNILDGVTSTAAELNILDGVTSTAAELNLIDGGTARGTTAVADGDGFLTNDGGTMRMTKVETLATYMGTKITGGSMVFIASSGAISSGTASVTFDDDDFDATKFDHYIFMLQYVRPGTDQVTFLCQVSTDGGSNFSTSSGDYHGENEENQIGFFL